MPSCPKSDWQVTSLEDDGKEEPLASNTVALFGASELMAQTETDRSANYDGLSDLFEDVRFVKQWVLDASGHVGEIEQLRQAHGVLRSEVDEMRSQLGQLSKLSYKRTQREHSDSNDFSNDLSLSVPVLRFTASTRRDDGGAERRDDQGADAADHGKHRHQPPKLGSARSCTLETFPASTYSTLEEDCILSKRLSEKFFSDWEYQIQAKIWDAILFIGTGLYPATDAIMVTVAFLVTLLIQFVFLGLVWNMLMEGVFDDARVVDRMQDWRVTYAHNPRYADPYTGMPVGESVCARSPFLMEGAQQAQLYGDISDYLSPFLGIPAGACLCILSIGLWVLTCAKRVSECFLLLWAIWTPQDSQKLKTPNITSGESSCFAGSSRSIESLALPRLTCVKLRTSTVGIKDKEEIHVQIGYIRAVMVTMGCFLPQVGLVIILGFAGIKFLIATIELSELVLNAVALEVVLNIDDVVFSALAPDNCREILTKTHSLRTPRSTGVVAVLVPYLKFFTVAGLMMLISLLMMMPVVKNLNDVDKVMCAGQTDFLSVSLAYGAVVAGKVGSSKISRDTLSYRATLQRTGLDQTGDPLYFEGRPFQVDSLETIKMWNQMSIKDWAEHWWVNDNFFGCVDAGYLVIYPHMKRAYWAALQSTMQNVSISSCADVRTFCTKPGNKGSTARLLCPDTCGGRDPRSGMVPFFPRHGTPRSCGRVRSLPSMRFACIDDTIADVQTSMRWQTFIQGLVDMMSPMFHIWAGGNMTEFHILQTVLRNNITIFGCGFFKTRTTYSTSVAGGSTPTTFHVDFCDPMELASLLGLHSVRPLCPQTCGCNTYVYQMLKTQHQQWTPETQCSIACMPSDVWPSL